MPFLYCKDADIPSIFGSALNSILYPLSKLKKFNIFFSKFIKSSLLKAFPKDNIGILCLIFLKFFDGLKPTDKEGESKCDKKLYFFSNSKIFFFKSSYSESSIIGLLL